MGTNNSTDLLTFEWDENSKVLEIHGNNRGLEKLRDKINILIAESKSDHTHLMAKSWGGDELSDEKQCSENILINHVKLFKWKK